MVNDDEVLARARATWREAAPSESDLHQGAQRVARRLRAFRRASSSRTLWTLAGSVAAFMATLAYAGVGRHRAAPDDYRAAVTSIDSAGAVTTAGQHGSSRGGIDRHRPNAPLGAPLAGDDEHAQLPLVRGVPVESLEPAIVNDETASAPQPLDPRSETAGVVASSSRAREHVRAPAHRGADPSWRAVSDALAAGKQWRAEQLLTRLAERGADANTRAKAKLGLGQLEASRGRCAKARQLALAVAGQDGIETKTVRRALELAARCLR